MFSIRYLNSPRGILKLFLIVFFLSVFSGVGSLNAGSVDFKRFEMQFKNFVTCALTRNDAPSYFRGEPFTVTMVDLFDITPELDLTIVTGSVQCFVKDRQKMLYVAVGVKDIMDHPHVSYMAVRHRDFTILGTELMRYPYKDKCQWFEYWIDTE